MLVQAFVTYGLENWNIFFFFSEWNSLINTSLSSVGLELRDASDLNVTMYVTLELH